MWCQYYDQMFYDRTTINVVLYIETSAVVMFMMSWIMCRLWTYILIKIITNLTLQTSNINSTCHPHSLHGKNFLFALVSQCRLFGWGIYLLNLIILGKDIDISFGILSQPTLLLFLSLWMTSYFNIWCLGKNFWLRNFIIKITFKCNYYY